MHMVIDSPGLVPILLTYCAHTAHRKTPPCQSQDSPKNVSWWKICAPLPKKTHELVWDLWFLSLNVLPSMQIISYKLVSTLSPSLLPTPPIQKQLLFDQPTFWHLQIYDLHRRDQYCTVQRAWTMITILCCYIYRRIDAVDLLVRFAIDIKPPIIMLGLITRKTMFI